MAGKFPHLRLIQRNQRLAKQSIGQQASSTTESFIIKALNELSESDQKRVRDIVADIVPGAAIIGVQKTVHQNDFRPIVLVPGEDSPTLVRLVPAEVNTSTSIGVRLHELFERIVNLNLTDQFETHDWGTLGNRLYYRRRVVNDTLAARLEDKQSFGFTDALLIMRSLVKIVTNLHNHGIIHGHICSQNIVLDKENNIKLLDPGMGVARIQARGVIQGYKSDSFAPETRESELLVFSSDVYGVGRVFQEVFSRFKIDGFEQTSEQQSSGFGSKTLSQLISGMCSEVPANRPKLSDIREFLGEVTAVSNIPETSGSTEPVQEEPQPSSDFKPESKTVSVQKGKAPKNIRQEIKWRERVDQIVDQIIEPEPTPVQEPVTEITVDAEKDDAPDSVQEVLSNILVTEDLPPVEGVKIEPEPQAVPPMVAKEERVPPPPLQPQAALDVPVEPKEIKAKPASTSNNNFSAFILFILIIAGGWYWINSQQNLEEYDYSTQELDLAWHSGRPSMMMKVARAALDKDNPSEFAELLIMRTAIKGDGATFGLNDNLVRIAFNKAWEGELKPEDRRLALSLALSALLKAETPIDLIPLNEAHPGVLLAIIASSGENAATILQTIPAQVLSNLPNPYRPAFLELLKTRPDLTLGDESVRDLAKIATVGIDSGEKLINFLQTDVESRLAAVLMLLQGNEQRAENVLSIVLEHPNIQLDDPNIAWAKQWGLSSWDEISAFDKLRTITGSVDINKVGVTNLAKFFAHPNPDARAKAIKRSIDLIKFEHKGAYEVLKLVAQSPSVLDAQQTFVLARLLENPMQAEQSMIDEWLASKPSADVIGLLLVTSAQHDKSSLLDFELTRYLKESDWKPNSDVIRLLTKHPEPLTRLYAYASAYSLEDRKLAKQILSNAKKTESDEDFKDQLNVMLKTFN